MGSRNHNGENNPHWKPLGERFWAKVVKRGELNCWGWVAAKDQFGYGRIEVDGKNLTAHRVSWELHNGQVPKGLYVLHTCDNPPCVNPRHLFLGTHSDNMQDMWDKKRHRPPNHAGSRHPRAKITEELVKTIREYYRQPGVTQKKLIGEFGLDQSHIHKIVSRKSWKHV